MESAVITDEVYVEIELLRKHGGYWNDATPNTFPDWVQITFNGAKTTVKVTLPWPAG